MGSWRHTSGWTLNQVKHGALDRALSAGDQRRPGDGRDLDVREQEALAQMAALTSASTMASGER